MQPPEEKLMNPRKLPLDRTGNLKMDVVDLS